MKVGDEAKFAYSIGVPAATLLRLEKRGNAAVAVFETRYELRSGDNEAISIARGNRVLRELQKLSDEAVAAPAETRRTQSAYFQLSSALQNARFMPTGGYVREVWLEDPVQAARKNDWVRRIGREIVAAEERIAYLEGLIADAPSIRQDAAAIERVTALARSLHDTTPIAYRFYMQVGDHEVNLIVAEDQ